MPFHILTLQKWVKITTSFFKNFSIFVPPLIKIASALQNHTLRNLVCGLWLTVDSKRWMFTSQVHGLLTAGSGSVIGLSFFHLNPKPMTLFLIGYLQIRHLESKP